MKDTLDFLFRQGRHAVRTKRLLGGGVQESFEGSLFEIDEVDRSFRSLSLKAPSTWRSDVSDIEAHCEGVWGRDPSLPG